MTKTTVSRADFFAPSLARRLAWVAVLAYLVYAAATLGLTLERVEKGIGYGVRFLAGFFPPSFTETDIVPGMLESVQIALLSSLIGTALAVPIAVLAARNLMPAGVSWAARLVIIFCRSFHPVIVAIVAVKAVGFGALAGIIALTFASIGFVGKLLAEAIAGRGAGFDVMARIPAPRFPGGTLLRYPGMVLGLLYYALRDRL